MQELYADVIIDISHEAIDRAFQYVIPEDLIQDVKIGCQVNIPFGRGDTSRKGYVIDITDHTDYDRTKLKAINSVSMEGVAASGRLLALAGWIKENYGSTMINALQTVLPVKKTVRSVTVKYVALTAENTDELEYRYLKKNASARLRLLRALMQSKVLPMSVITGDLGVSSSTVKSMQNEGVLVVTEDNCYRKVTSETVINEAEALPDIELNDIQRQIVSEFGEEFERGIHRTYLLHGVTGSGKTEVYIHCIRRVIEQGKQAIVLIPEIALTYQTIKHFTRYFGDRVTVVNSRLSSGEKYDQFERARKGDVDVVIGPRSALFTPFERLGLIIIDEEHEGSYKSDNPPKYHARETAIKRAELEGASVILGSATPSVESYKSALEGRFKLWYMGERVSDRAMAETSIVDLREELRCGNRSIISNELAEDIANRLENREQIMLFINKRGFNSFVSCRNCGEVIKCPHCDVSMTRHISGSDGRLICHYCGYAVDEPKTCPSCGSKLIGGYGTGTEKVEQEVRRMFPGARTLRMDRDTTSKKNSHEQILDSFGKGEADILIGTQMIVKGHDFANVTLVGILLADLTLFDGDYRAGERTFDLLTQAAGRAGRGDVPGKVVIQTYKPDNYAIIAAANQDYRSFYETESAYRSFMRYPPFWNMLVIMAVGNDEEQLANIMDRLYSLIREKFKDVRNMSVIGPSEPALSKIKDMYRKVIYIKNKDYNVLVDVKNTVEAWMKTTKSTKCEEDKCANTGINVFFDFNPMNMY